MVDEAVVQARLALVASPQYGEAELRRRAEVVVEEIDLLGRRRGERDRERHDVAVAAYVVRVLGPARRAALQARDPDRCLARVGGAAGSHRVGHRAELDDTRGRARREYERSKKGGYEQEDSLHDRFPTLGPRPSFGVYL